MFLMLPLGYVILLTTEPHCYYSEVFHYQAILYD